jgi:septal ring factor EnvC (AmiA/AmiB activator)
MSFFSISSFYLCVALFMCLTDHVISCCFTMFSRKAREKQFKEQEESLQEWEQKIKESQNRLVDLQRSINDREERANKNDQLLKIKENELEEARKTLEATRVTVKVKEDDINKRLNELQLQDKVAKIIDVISFLLFSECLLMFNSSRDFRLLTSDSFSGC